MEPEGDLDLRVHDRLLGILRLLGHPGGGESPHGSDHFIAGRRLPGPIFIVAATATCYSGWAFLGHAGLIYRDGLQYAYVSFAPITIPLPGILFLKRQWILGQRFGFITRARCWPITSSPI